MKRVEQAVVDIINKNSCKNKTLMILIRRLVLASMTWNVIFRSKHIKGKTNIVAWESNNFSPFKAVE
jgi:hypothetical protein